MINLHLWFIVNLAVIGIGLVNPKLYENGLWMIMLFSTQMLRSRKEVKETYTKPTSKKELFFIFLFVSFLVVSAFMGFTEKWNEFDKSHPEISVISKSILAVLVVFCYFYLLFKKQKEKCKS